MDFLLNILWVILGGGWLICLEYLAAGVVLCLTVVGIPFGLQCFKLAKLGLVPFGHDFDEVPGAGVGSFALNVLWLVLAGISIFLSHLVLGVGLALTIIGIPFAYQHLKFGMLALAPFGKQLQR